MSDQPHLSRLQQNALRAADSLRVQNVAPQLEAVWLRAASKG
jgi:hypothetical protein